MKFAKNLCTMFILKLNSQADRFFYRIRVFRIKISNFGLHGTCTTLVALIRRYIRYRYRRGVMDAWGPQLCNTGSMSMEVNNTAVYIIMNELAPLEILARSIPGHTGISVKETRW